MPYTILNLVRTLNEYANLVLVVITAVYVWLTWRTLRALREASLHEREALHLRDIKEHVLQPAISWITQTVFGRFTGRSPELLTVSNSYGSGARRITHTVDDPFTSRRRLNTPADPDTPDPLSTWTEGGRISELLLKETKLNHFPTEMQAFDQLIEDVRQLTATLVFLANEAAPEIAESEIPQALGLQDQNSMPEWCDPYQFTADCIQSFLAGIVISPVRVETYQSWHLLLNIHNQAVAKGTDAEKLKHWSDLGFQKVRRRWEGNSLGQKVTNLLERADTVRRSLDQLMFTQTLGVNCELVGGKKHHRRNLLRDGKSPPRPRATP